jgi:hypothetical protein
MSVHWPGVKESFTGFVHDEGVGTRDVTIIIAPQTAGLVAHSEDMIVAMDRNL